MHPVTGDAVLTGTVADIDRYAHLVLVEWDGGRIGWLPDWPGKKLGQRVRVTVVKGEMVAG